MSVQQLEAKTEQKLKGINADNAVSALALFIRDRPIGSKNRDIIRRDLEMFQAIVGRLQDKEYDGLMQTLKENEAQVLLDYLHRYMLYVGESQNQAISSGLMLRLYERVIKEYGPSIIIGACLRSDTLVSKISSF